MHGSRLIITYVGIYWVYDTAINSVVLVMYCWVCSNGINYHLVTICWV